MKMNEYDVKAQEFLEETNTKFEAIYLGLADVDWDSRLHDHYHIILTSPKSRQTFDFYASLHDTERHNWTNDDIARREFHMDYEGLDMTCKNKVCRLRKEYQEESVARPYDVLACLEKYRHGSFNEFCREFGYSNDSISAQKTYFACQEEYEKVCKLFTREQIKELREIW